ncbi:oligosaccharide flippase family protein [Paremcibacter congregatus]|uniref:oligosaccharide flippase family protein n=1 Tax=Paremcibacter congregatus TaxID=2043170 RepID=UPI003A8F3F0E
MSAKEARDKSDIVRGAGLNFLGFLVRLSSRLPFILLVVALFGNALYGRYIFTITIVELAAALAVFGFKNSLFKFVMDIKYSNGHTTEEIIVAALCSAVTVGLLLVGVIVAGADLLAQFFDYPEMVAGLRSIAPVLLLIAINEILLAGTRISRNMKYEVAAKSFIEPYVLLISMLVFYFLDFGAPGLLLAYTVSIMASLATSICGCAKLYSLRNFITARPRFYIIKAMFKFSAPTAFHDLALLVFMRLDVFIVKYFFSESILGIYDIAQQITTSVEKIYQSFYPILAPVMAKNLVEKDYAVVERQMVMVSRWTLMVQCVLVVLAVFYGTAFMTMIADTGTSPETLAAGGVVLLFLMMGQTINGGFGMTDMPLLYRFPIFNPIISLMMVVLYASIAWGFVQILKFDMKGVAIALCCTYFIMNLARVIVVRRLMGINMLQMSLLRVVIAAIGSVAIFQAITHIVPVNLLSGSGIALGAPLLVVIYGASVMGFCMTPGDKKKLLGRFKRKDV